MKILYIDVQNSMCRFTDNHREMDWQAFFVYITKRYAINRIYFAVGFTPSLQEFYDEMTSYGYTLLYKDTVRKNGALKGNVDIDIAIQSVCDYKDGVVSEVFLMTNDGDYNTLIQFFQKNKVWGKLLTPDIRSASRAITRLDRDAVDLEFLKYFFTKQKASTGETF